MRQVLFVVLFFSFLCGATHAFAAPLHVEGTILMDLDSAEVIYEQNANRKIPPASLTKIMTMYIIFDALKSKKLFLNTKVKVSKKAAETPGSSMGLHVGEVATVKQLLYGMAVASGNDACVAMAEHMSGSEKAFAHRMNSKARKLKMENTFFKTVSGLPAKGQYTTARDMLILSRNYITIHPKSLNYHSTKSVIFHGKTLRNKHPQLGKYRGTDGLKTGWTRASGYNIISTSQRGNKRLIAVILGAETSKLRAKELNRLMNAGFHHKQGKTKSVYSLLSIN